VTSVYLDVAVESIQAYLSRTTDLKGRRGASAWLSDLTDRDELRQRLQKNSDGWAAGVSVNDEAGEADGVVPLKLTPGCSPQEVAEAVFAQLRGKLPALRMTAAWATADTYVAAYPLMPGRGDGPAAGNDAGHLDSLPAPGDFPLLVSCEQCRADPRVTHRDLHERKNVPMCADCAGRYDDRYRKPALRTGAVPVSAELRLLDALGLTPKDVVETFADLAEIPGPSRKRNHLATVFADGNAMGALFREVLARRDDELKRRVSREVSQATRDALVAATRAAMAVDPRPQRMPVIPHVVGGDDLLVTVTADRAWPFVRTYLTAFGERMRRIADEAELPRPSASAGVVFAHHTFPFRRCVELAEQALRHAKQAHHGQTPAVSWLDVTRDGEQRPPGRAAWTLPELTGRADWLTDLAEMEQSAKAALERLAGSGGDGSEQVRRARIANQASRLQLDGLRSASGLLDASGGPDRLVDALSLVRWWQ